MRSMPRNMRGDFVYIGNGTIFSNRPAIAKSVVSESFNLSGEPVAGRTKMDLTPGQGQDIGTGPYFREQSSSGLTAFTVTLPCGAEALAIDGAGFPDDGFAYSGGTGADGDSVDAGLQYNPDGGIQPFISVTNGAQWTNQSQHYYCNSQAPGNTGTIGVFFGEIIPNLLFLATGLPENPPPQQSPWPPGQTNWDDGAWVYFPPPGQWQPGGTDSVGEQTPCVACTVKRITSIGQKGGEYFYDGSCFGGCPQPYASVHWGSVEMGQIVPPCPVKVGAPATQCSISAYQDGRWFGSLVDFSGNPNSMEYSGENATYASEGINLDPCTLDSYGYCSMTGTTTVESSVQCLVDGPHGQYEKTFPTKTTTPYQIYGETGLLETATATRTYGGTCPIIILKSTSWSPAEPKSQYNDPNLP